MAELEPPKHIARLIARVVSLTGLLPTIDVPLATLVTRYRFPGDAAFALFAVARSVGLLARSMEQLGVDSVIRPLGRDTGPIVEVQQSARRQGRKASRCWARHGVQREPLRRNRRILLALMAVAAEAFLLQFEGRGAAAAYYL